MDTPTRDSSGHYIDGIETTDYEFTKDNKKRPSRYLTIQQREEVVYGRDIVKSSLGKARELKQKFCEKTDSNLASTSENTSRNEVLEYPAFVRMIVESRPEAKPEHMFKAWKPMYIKPDEKNNLEDLAKLLESRLESRACKHISEELRPKAVEIISQKSMVGIDDADD